MIHTNESGSVPAKSEKGKHCRLEFTSALKGRAKIDSLKHIGKIAECFLGFKVCIEGNKNVNPKSSNSITIETASYLD